MHRIRAVALLACVLVTTVLTAQDARVPQPLALTHVTVIDVRDGSLHRDQTVIIRGDRVTAVGAAADTAVPDAAHVIDARGRYLIPGLWDMHVHSVANANWHFPLFLAFGVTGVRDMNDGAGDVTLELTDTIKRQLAEGSRRGPPRFLVAGPAVDGDPYLGRSKKLVARTAAEARAVVEQLASNGADLIKVYENVSREAYFAIIDEARRRKIPVDGHLPFRITPKEAAAAGQRTVEHPEALAAACSTTADAERKRFAGALADRNGLPGSETLLLMQIRHYRALYDSRDPAACASAFEVYRQHGVAVTADLLVYHYIVHAEQVLADTARMRLVPEAIRRNWEDLLKSETTRELQSILRPIPALELQNVRLANEAGVVLLAATDVDIPMGVPGLSLHEELVRLVAAGLTPLETLRTATLNPARVLGLAESLGTIEPGKLADLVLLDANPLEDIRNSQKIAAVVADGRYLDRQALDDLLASAERAAQQPSDSLVEAVVYTTLRPPNWDIYLFDKPAGAPRRLTDDPALDYNAVFSPDGRWIVFTSERTGNTDLYALNVKDDGELVRLTQHHGMDDAASFSPDGRRLAFVSTHDGDADIFVMPFAPGNATAEQRAVNLTRRSGGDFNPAFSPDGRRIAFSRQERWDDVNTPEREEQAVELYVMDADGSNARRLSKPGLPQAGRAASFPLVSGSPAWSRDGQAIYYYRLRAEGFEIRRITPDGSGDVHIAPDGFSPAVRPDGRIAFVRPPAGADRRPTAGDVVSVAAAGSDSRIESKALDSCFAPDFDRGSGRMVCHGPGPIAGFAVLGDGRAFAPPDAMRRVHLPDRTLTVRGIRGSFPALTPAGEVISTLRGVSAAATRAGETQRMTVPLHVSAVDGGGLRELFKPPSGVSWGAAVARDAGWLVTAVGPPFAGDDARVDIWKLRIDGSDAVNLTPGSSANDAFPHISADGRRIVFRSSRGGQRAVYVMDSDETDPRRLTDADARETMPALSPDGEWVVFATLSGVEFAGRRRDSRRQGDGSMGGKLWLQRVDDSERRLLEPERAHIADFSLHPRFSPDGKWVVFTSDRGGFNDEWPLTGAPQPYGELWAVPVSGGAAVRLTHDKWEDGPSDWGYVRLPHRER